MNHSTNELNQNIGLVRVFFRLFRRLQLFLTRLFPSLRKKVFIRLWSEALCSDAKVFNGLYNGLVRVESCEASYPQKTLKEWYDRTRFKWENVEITKLSEKVLNPVIERASPEECAKWASLLLKAAEAAGLRKEEGKSLLLNDHNANAYTEWNGKELFIGDIIEIMFPAWYQNGMLIEQGICTLVTVGED